MSAFEFAVLFGIACCVLWNVLAVKQMLEKHDDHAPSDDNDEGWSSQGTLRIE